MSPPQISILIPAYNAAEFLSKAIESALEQTAPPLEILVADDGSADDTARVAACYGSSVKYRRFRHVGVYALRTQMLAEIRGEWFLNLDADNWIAPDFLERMIAAVGENQVDDQFAFAYPDMELFGENTGRVERSEFDAQRLKLGNYIDMNAVIRTTVARRFGFDPAFNSGQGDYDFFLTLVKNGYRGVRVPKALLYYRVHGGSISQRVGRKRNQKTIMQRIVRKHRDFFSPAEARVAMASANNRVLVAIIGSRSPFAGFGSRLTDWFRFLSVGLRHAEFREQTVYCFRPCRYFARQNGPVDIYYLFRESSARRNLIRRIAEGQRDVGGTEQLFGFNDLQDRGLALDCNLRWPRTKSLAQVVHHWRDRRYAPRTGIGLGDMPALWVHLDSMNQANIVVATADNVGLPAIRLKQQGLLSAPLIYVSIGLPERMGAVERIDPARAERYRRRFSEVERVVAYGYAEAEWLHKWLESPGKVRFVPFGVNVDSWKPMQGVEESLDVLSLGFDHQRDFGLLVNYARQHPDVSVCLVTSFDRAASLGTFPPNLRLLCSVSIEKVRELMASAKLIALPVKENTYSGATTTLLQAMAMGKACAVSHVGAIRDGYGLEDGTNVRWMEPGQQADFDAVVDSLLAQPEMRRYLGAAAREHVAKRLSWRQYVDAMLGCMSDWIQPKTKK